MRYIMFAALLLGLVASGCGPGGNGVTGEVTLDGDAVPNATVEFTPKAGGRSGVGTTDSSGKFTLKYLLDNPNLPAGEYVVTITTASSEEDDQGNTIDIPEKLPPKYNLKSELTRTIEDGGENNFKFELKSDG